jgi:hypothetical protein
VPACPLSVRALFLVRFEAVSPNLPGWRTCALHYGTRAGLCYIFVTSFVNVYGRTGALNRGAEARGCGVTLSLFAYASYASFICAYTVMMLVLLSAFRGTILSTLGLSSPADRTATSHLTTQQRAQVDGVLLRSQRGFWLVFCTCLITTVYWFCAYYFFTAELVAKKPYLKRMAGVLFLLETCLQVLTTHYSFSSGRGLWTNLGLALGLPEHWFAITDSEGERASALPLSTPIGAPRERIRSASLLEAQSAEGEAVRLHRSSVVYGT